MTATDKMAAWMNLPSLDATLLMRPQARMAEALLRQNIEILGFVKDRMERDRALWPNSRHCAILLRPSISGRNSGSTR
ncbi:hypothetical protein ACFSHQ_15350 [Gemmobacter lanyuensis]